LVKVLKVLKILNFQGTWESGFFAGGTGYEPGDADS
jgi:hypothetical protein